MVAIWDKSQILAAMHHFHTYTFEPFPENVESLNFNAAMNRTRG